MCGRFKASSSAGEQPGCASSIVSLDDDDLGSKGEEHAADEHDRHQSDDGPYQSDSRHGAEAKSHERACPVNSWVC